MKLLRHYLPSGALLLGMECYYLRRVLYVMYVDETGLLKTGTALEWGVYALTALSALLFAMAAKKQIDLTPNPAVAAVGQCIGGLGLGWTALFGMSTRKPVGPGLVFAGIGGHADRKSVV